MRSKIPFLAVFLLVPLLGTCLFAETPKELTGDDWIRMLQDEKLEFVSVALKVHESQGLKITKPAKYYAYLLNTAIMGNTEYESENVTYILNTILYQNEPSFQSRVHESKAPVQKIEMH